MFQDLWSLILTLIVCVLAGLIASAIMNQRGNSLLTNLLLGFGGSIIANIIAGALHIYFWGIVSSLIFATLGAVLLIWVWQSFMRGNVTAGRRF